MNDPSRRPSPVGDTVPAPPPSFLPQSPINADKTYDDFDGFAIPLHELDFEED
jgi:hypothetical protein